MLKVKQRRVKTEIFAALALAAMGRIGDTAEKGLTFSQATFPIPLPCCERKAEIVARLCI
jgi:hypothetical protein